MLCSVYTIWIVSPDGYSHSSCFLEVAQALQAAFIEFGHSCDITITPPTQRENVIILGAHLLHPDDMLCLVKPVVWQLEQIPDDTDQRSALPITDTYLTTLRRATVWDYNHTNIANLKKCGIEATHLDIGYMPTLSRIENDPIPSIDVLFIGSLNERRTHILVELQKRGVFVKWCFNEYGVNRDALISRAKIILNVHYYPAKLFEIVRCSYLMANRKCILSEIGYGGDDYDEGICFRPYEELVDSCVSLLDDKDKRDNIAERGFEIFSRHSQTEMLKKLLV